MLDTRKSLAYLLILRWAALLQLVLLHILGIHTGPTALFLAIALYSLLLTVFRFRVTNLIRKYPLLLQLDLLIAAVAIWLTGGNWKSPYFAYVYTCLMVLPFFHTLKGSLIATANFSILYTVGLLMNDPTLAHVKAGNDYDSFISTYVAFFLTTIFFGYPAGIIRQIDKTVQDTVDVREHISEAKRLLNAANDSIALSSRELEVYSLLGEGKANAQIAEELFISEKTVKNHLYRIYKKLGVSSRSKALIQYHNELVIKDLDNR